MKKLITLLLGASLIFTSCKIIRPGQAGVKQKLGKLSNEVRTQGNILYNPFTSKVIIASIRRNNLELNLSLPSKEGLSVQSQISILYQIKKDSLPKLITNLGLNYEPIISNVFRSTASDVCANYFAKDMHSGMRAQIEDSIMNKMNHLLSKDGLVVQSVLMKSIRLPAGLARSIEQKLQAEQDAMRMRFIIEREKLEAQRKIIAAEGIRDSQKILSEGLTDQILKVKHIEALLKLAESPNAKIIMTADDTPFLIE
ncbi:MAG: prohibitin family protein [Flavobacteriales bacterium]